MSVAQSHFATAALGFSLGVLLGNEATRASVKSGLRCITEACKEYPLLTLSIFAVYVCHALFKPTVNHSNKKPFAPDPFADSPPTPDAFDLDDCRSCDKCPPLLNYSEASTSRNYEIVPYTSDKLSNYFPGGFAHDGFGERVVFDLDWHLPDFFSVGKRVRLQYATALYVRNLQRPEIPVEVVYGFAETQFTVKVKVKFAEVHFFPIKKTLQQETFKIRNLKTRARSGKPYSVRTKTPDKNGTLIVTFNLDGSYTKRQVLNHQNIMQSLNVEKDPSSPLKMNALLKAIEY